MTLTMKGYGVVTKQIKKTYANTFLDTKVGDIFTFEVPIEASGRSGRMTYATYITVANTRTRKTGEYSFNQLAKIMSSFEWDRIGE